MNKPAERIWLWWADGYRKGTPPAAAQVAFEKPNQRSGIKAIEYMRVLPGAEIAKLHRRLECQQAAIRQLKKLIPDIDQPNR